MLISALLFLFSIPLVALSQVDSKNLIGHWCVEKVTDLPQEAGKKETLQTQIMDEFQGVIMLFTNNGEYTVYLEELSEIDDYQEFANYEFISRDSKIKIQYPETDETIVYEVEKLTKDQFIFILNDELGLHRFYMKRCD
jgi:hypothetical protein